MAQSAIAVRDLVVRYGDVLAVHIPFLEIRERETLAVIGPNGAGKSTLLRVLGLLEKPTGGAVFFRGQPVPFKQGALLGLRRRMGMVFQDPLLVDATVFDNVALGLKFRGAQAPDEKVRRWLAHFGILDLSDRPARTLSGGQAHRASLARAFVLDPEVLLLDEPFSALDPPTRDGLVADLKATLAQTRTTAVLVTHDREEARILGDRVAVMIRGRLLQIDVSERVFSQPVDVETARFVGVENLLPGRVVSSRDGMMAVDVRGWIVRVAGQRPVGAQVQVCVRAKDVVLSRAHSGMAGRVTRVVGLGAEVRVEVDCGMLVVARMGKGAFADAKFRESDCVAVSFDGANAHVI